MARRILGLDLGSASIGWAVVEENSVEIVSEDSRSSEDRILALGSRIVPLTTDENIKFSKGKASTINAERTKKRTIRKGYDRYQLRRRLLLEYLGKHGMYDGVALHLTKLELWGLRARAVNERISLLELGRVLCHINQKRGYKTAKSDFEDKAHSDYIMQVVDRYRVIREQNLTIGQYMHKCIFADPAFRCKDRVFPRRAYEEEYDAIMKKQQEFYPNILTDEVIAHIRDYIIFFQRPLKSCKHLVSRCELERHDVKINNRIKNCGPKVTPRSSPLFQVCKIWENINNLQVFNKVNEPLEITLAQKQSIFEFLNTHKVLKIADMKSILGIKSKEWKFKEAIGNGLQGNVTYCAISEALGNHKDKDNLLRFDLKTVETDVVNTKTGEFTKIIDASFEQQPLYKLWHTLYSVDIDNLHKLFEQKFGITDKAVLDRLCRIDFTKSGYSNKSSRAIRKILPYLQEGAQYFEAKILAGYDDTPLNKEQNASRELSDTLLPIPKGSLRQPVVEKVLNQMVNVVNALMLEYGRFDEIRVELARELKQSREERESTTNMINRNNKKNQYAADRIKEYKVFPTKARIEKYRLWNETDHKCIYCGKTVGIKEFLLGSGFEIEHIIPRSVLFDDSFSNKVCACRECNQEKGNRTAYDFMMNRPEHEFNAFIERVDKLSEEYNPNSKDTDKGISLNKKRKLLMPQDRLPNDFIERQLRETQYIAKKAKEMLQSVCTNVYTTSGTVTDFIRHVWGWDNILHSLNFESYRRAGLTEVVEREIEGNKVKVERIVGWSKRLDHRHHAIDALVIACTKQKYIQRINNLNSLKDVSFCSFNDKGQGLVTSHRLTRLERYLQMQPHFSIAEVSKFVSGILVSFKNGKRAASIGKRYIYKDGKKICVQNNILIPRGALSDESVYGCILNNGKHSFVIKYKVSDITKQNVNDVVDLDIRERLHHRLEQFKGDAKKAFAEPVMDHQGRVIRSVRCYRNMKNLLPLRYDEHGSPISFVNPSNNHHVAIYEDEYGKLHEHIVTFWHAVERKKYGLPVIIKEPCGLLDKINDTMPKTFIEQLPMDKDWHLKFFMQQNEMFILGMDEDSYQKAKKENDIAVLSNYLFRVQKLSSGDYYFRKHNETQSDDKYPDNTGKIISNQQKSKNRGVLYRTGIAALQKLNPHKVHVGITGKISEI